MPLSEGTKVSVPLGYIVSGLIASVVAFGGWMWRVQEQIYDIKQDVAVIKATVVPAAPKVASK